jgi:hypothetical protein
MFKLRREIPLIPDEIIEPIAGLARHSLRSCAEFEFHALEFAHASTMERILCYFKRSEALRLQQ